MRDVRAALRAVLNFDGRLALIAPVLEAGIKGHVVAGLPRARRNVAEHHFGVCAGDIPSLTRAELNRLQRQGHLQVAHLDSGSSVACGDNSRKDIIEVP